MVRIENVSAQSLNAQPLLIRIVIINLITSPERRNNQCHISKNRFTTGA